MNDKYILLPVSLCVNCALACIIIQSHCNLVENELLSLHNENDRGVHLFFFEENTVHSYMPNK
jgi:hypothetical protein